MIRFIQLVLGMEPLFEKIIEGVETRTAALKLENMMIDEIGTLELGTGPLVNIKPANHRLCNMSPSVRVMFEFIENVPCVHGHVAERILTKALGMVRFVRECDGLDA